ncbi:hypothetical protein BJ742DRAFT_785578 [Cladochytrium replicatum]|nr:hypothetical protein BJ742DRAFT_785578 [Cladochytrium replicatum]
MAADISWLVIRPTCLLIPMLRGLTLAICITAQIIQLAPIIILSTAMLGYTLILPLGLAARFQITIKPDLNTPPAIC